MVRRRVDPAQLRRDDGKAMTTIDAALEAWGPAREKAEAASELERQIVRGLFLGAWLWRSYQSRNCASSVGSSLRPSDCACLCDYVHLYMVQHEN
jgi:hypothetical protein